MVPSLDFKKRQNSNNNNDRYASQVVHRIAFFFFLLLCVCRLILRTVNSIFCSWREHEFFPLVS